MKNNVLSKKVWSPVKFFNNLFVGLFGTINVWLVLSWLNIVFNNTTENPVYWDFNLLVMLFEAFM